MKYTICELVLAFTAILPLTLRSENTREYTGYVGTREATCDLTFKDDATIVGGYTCPEGKGIKYELKGNLSENGVISLVEFTEDLLTARLELVKTTSEDAVELTGLLKNLDGRILRVSLRRARDDIGGSSEDKPFLPHPFDDETMVNSPERFEKKRANSLDHYSGVAIEVKPTVNRAQLRAVLVKLGYCCADDSEEAEERWAREHGGFFEDYGRLHKFEGPESDEGRKITSKRFELGLGTPMRIPQAISAIQKLDFVLSVTPLEFEGGGPEGIVVPVNVASLFGDPPKSMDGKEKLNTLLKDFLSARSSNVSMDPEVSPRDDFIYNWDVACRDAIIKGADHWERAQIWMRCAPNMIGSGHSIVIGIDYNWAKAGSLQTSAPSIDLEDRWNGMKAKEVTEVEKFVKQLGGKIEKIYGPR